MGFRREIGFMENLQIVITCNRDAISNSHTLQFTAACTNSSKSDSVCHTTSLLFQLSDSQTGENLTTISYSFATLNALLVLLKTSWPLPCKGYLVNLASKKKNPSVIVYLPLPGNSCSATSFTSAAAYQRVCLQ
jgi:hypothetical protein